MRNTLYFTLLLLFSLNVSAQDCSINDLVAEPHECVNGQFLVDIDFNVQNPEADQFGVVGNATDYGLFSYADLPITLGPLDGDGETVWEFIVYDTENPDCQATTVLGIVTCCEIYDVVYDALDCDNQETFSAIINFNTTNTSGVGFDVFDADENFLGFFNYDDLPVTVEGIPSSGTGDDAIIICDNDNSNCCTLVEIEGPDCDPTDCEIYDVVVDPDDCESGQFNILLTFQYENTSGTFTIQGNGNNYGTFSYDNLPIQLGPFVGNGETIYEFVVIDSEVDGCSDFAVLTALDCPEACGFNDIVVEPFDCTSDTTYHLDLDFIPVSTGNEGFSVYTGDSVSLGSYSYENLPVTIENFPASGDFFDELVICDNLDPECCDTVMFEALLCAECVIYDMVVETTECDSNDQFFVVINFEYQNVGDNGFQVGGNGNTYGTFGYEDLPLTLGPFDGDNETFWEFVVFDLDNPLCIQGQEVGLINCVNPCEIGELMIDFVECSGDGTYDIVLNFEYANVDSVGFDVFAGDDLIGFYSYEDLPVLIENFPASGMDFDHISVCDNDNPDCCSTAEFLSPGCFDVCDIYEIIVAPVECTSDSTFAALITFMYEDLESDFVEISANDVSLGTYHIDSLPVLVDGFSSSDFNTVVTICNLEAANCCGSKEFQSLNCDTTCTFFIVENIEECLDDGTYGVVLDWSGNTNGDVDSFQVWVNGEFHSVQPPEGLIDIEGLPGNGENTVITVCVDDMLDCCSTVEFEAPMCDVDTCDINELNLDPLDCNDNGTFDAWLNFNYEGLISSFVNIRFNGELVGIFPVDSVPLYLEGLPGTGGNAVITVCDNDNNQCCGILETEVPECQVECSISEIDVVQMECGGNGTYYIVVEYISEGLDNEFVDVYINGESAGFYPVDSNIVIDGLVGNGQEVVLTICENDNAECCGSLTYEAPDCAGCVLNELVVDPDQCTSDSTYGAWINYHSVGIDSNGVSVYADGEFLGSYPAITPIYVNGFPSGDGNILVEVCGNEQSSEEPCCAQAEVEQLNCLDGCPILAINVEPSECDSNGQFTATLTMELSGTQTGGFLVAGNGMSYGSFSYENLPITLGPLDGDNETPWEFVAIDLGDTECSAAFNLGPIDCGTSGLFGPGPNVRQLEVRYDAGRPFFFVPESDLVMTIWNTTGQLVRTEQLGSEGDIIDLADRSNTSGVVIITLTGGEKMYVARAVLAE